MLCGKQLQLSLHERKGGTQFMGSITGKLPLGCKGLIQPVQHLIKRMTQPVKLRQKLFVHFHVCKIVDLYLFYLRRKAA